MKVEEEAWNAYPYTKTRYRCPFIDRFSLEIETIYLPDCGTEENVFRLTKKEFDQRTVGKTRNNRSNNQRKMIVWNFRTFGHRAKSTSSRITGRKSDDFSFGENKFVSFSFCFC